MSDNQAQPPGGPEPRDRDPWAPPESSAAQNKVPLDKPAAPRPQVHDQPTVTSMPGAGPAADTGAGGAVPPPPIAPGGPAQPTAGPYGYPAAPNTPQPGPGAPYGPGADPYPGYPGYPGYQGMNQTGWQAGPANGMGITAMVLGIIATVLFCFYGLGVILGVLAVIFGFIGRGRAQRGEATNGGMALAGIILGIIGALISAAFIGFLIWAYTNDGFDDSNDDPWSSSLVVDDRR